MPKLSMVSLVVLTIAMMTLPLLPSSSFSLLISAKADLQSYSISASNALMAKVKAGKEQCFYERVYYGQTSKIFLHFTVSDAEGIGIDSNENRLDIDVRIFDPLDNIIWETVNTHESRVLFKVNSTPSGDAAEESRKAREDNKDGFGEYRICFSNTMSGFTTKTVLFNVVLGKVSSNSGYPGEDGMGAYNIDPMERAIGDIYETLVEIRNEQTYLNAREVSHRDTAESTLNYILLWSLLEISLIVLMGMGLVSYLKNTFEKHRNI